MKNTILALALAAGLAGAAGPETGPVTGGVINPNCLEALQESGLARLGGLFSFIAEKDSPAAFADLVMHDGKALKKYLAKLDRDLKLAGGIVTWDHDVLTFALQILSSPVADTVDKAAAKSQSRMSQFSLAPTLSLEQMAARRKK